MIDWLTDYICQAQTQCKNNKHSITGTERQRKLLLLPSQKQTITRSRTAHTNVVLPACTVCLTPTFSSGSPGIFFDLTIFYCRFSFNKEQWSRRYVHSGKRFTLFGHQNRLASGASSRTLRMVLISPPDPPPLPLRFKITTILGMGWQGGLGERKQGIFCPSPTLHCRSSCLFLMTLRRVHSDVTYDRLGSRGHTTSGCRRPPRRIPWSS